jgi:hypothetical protein
VETHFLFFVAAVVAGAINSLAGGGELDDLGRPGGRLPWGYAHRQGEPYRSTRGSHGYRVRPGGVLLLDAVRTTRAAHRGRVTAVSVHRFPAVLVPQLLTIKTGLLKKGFDDSSGARAGRDPARGDRARGALPGTRLRGGVPGLQGAGTPLGLTRRASANFRGGVLADIHPSASLCGRKAPKHPPAPSGPTGTPIEVRAGRSLAFSLTWACARS